jgi:hypothetical protein
MNEGEAIDRLKIDLVYYLNQLIIKIQNGDVKINNIQTYMDITEVPNLKLNIMEAYHNGNRGIAIEYYDKEIDQFSEKRFGEYEISTPIPKQTRFLLVSSNLIPVEQVAINKMDLDCHDS